MAVEIYQHIKVEFQPNGFGGGVYTGFSRSEINSLFQIFGVPDDKKVDTLNRLSILENKTINLLNQRRNTGGK